jgi:hypothetical protein
LDRALESAPEYEGDRSGDSGGGDLRCRHDNGARQRGTSGYIRWQNLPQNLKDAKETRGGVSIEVVPGDEDMRLIIPMRKSSKPGEE